MDISNFEDIADKYQINKNALNQIKKRLMQGMENEDDLDKINKSIEVTFTDLQKKAFNNKSFWRGNAAEERKHIIVQGTTSSGKTLVSEIAILDCLKSHKKSIVLVPLKAMVRERWEHLKKDFEPQGVEQIYASSSDFQNHDGEIINGEYEVAIIVYEKFFAMLSQENNNILMGCELLVVDEMQMLSSMSRGPKLEIAIQKVLRRNNEAGGNNGYTRIMCLTTCDCKVNYIKKWLTVVENGVEKAPVLIESKKRPVGLREFIIKTDGSFCKKYFAGENDTNDKIKKEEKDIEGEIQVEEYNKNLNAYEKKKLLLKALLKNIYDKRPDAKVLIYVNSRKSTLALSRYITNTGILPIQPVSNELQKINEYEEDEYQKEIKNKLFSRRMAIHNAAMSTELREFIEDEFSKEKELKLIIATETLTVGMNMPVDVMILFDASVHTGNGIGEEELTSQQYKNFVGRAGRLGQHKRVGESYIIATTDGNFKKYCDYYLNCRQEEIESALLQGGETEQAPYYLGLMDSGKCLIEDLEKLWETSFSNKCNGKHIDMKKVVSKLCEANLCRISKEPWVKQNSYELNSFGKVIAPYALALDTCQRIYYYFLHGADSEITNEPCGVPKDIKASDIDSDIYLLDMLYIICDSEEVRRLGQMKIPYRDAVVHRQTLDLIEKNLNKMISCDQDSENRYILCKTWKNSGLKMALDEYGIEDSRPETIMRAILLWYWTKGETISKIKEKTGFGKYIPIVAGDLARMAEAVSYQIEAISLCYSRCHTEYDSNIVRPLYSLSTRVKYGMPKEPVCVANLHIRGLDRTTILKLWELYKKLDQYDNLYDFIKKAPNEMIQKFMSSQKRKSLVDEIEGLYMSDNHDGVLRNIEENVGLNDGEVEAIQNLYNKYEDDLLLEFEKLFDNPGVIKLNKRFYDTKIQLSYSKNKELAILKIGKSSFLFGVYTEKEYIDDEFSNIVEEQKVKSILLLKTDELFSDFKMVADGCMWKKSDDSENPPRIDLIMTVKSFVDLIIQDIALYDHEAVILEEMLNDTYGIYNSMGLKATCALLQNYQGNLREISSEKLLNVVCDKRNQFAYKNCKTIMQKLKEKDISSYVVSWGIDAIDKAKDKNIILLCLKQEMINNSKSMKILCAGLKDKMFKNVYAIFDSEESYRAWQTLEPELPCITLRHHIGYENMDEIIYDIENIINKKEEDNKYLIGISYAHNSGEERFGVHKLKKVVKELNKEFGEDCILFDQNPSCIDLFDGNGAKEYTLKLYEQCEYYIILDDQYYDIKECCEREGKVIKKRLENDLQRQHLWLVFPENEEHCSLYNDVKDFPTILCTENAEKIARSIIREIHEQKKNTN